MESFDGKVAFVTGGASGMGLAIGKALAAQGARVALADIDPEQLAGACQGVTGEVTGLQLDVRDRAGWSKARAQVEAKYGPTDLLFNNAGIAPDGRDLADTEPDSFDRMVAINITGVYNGIHEFAGAMRERRSGHIVNTASMSGLMSAPGLGPYTAAKAAVVMLSEVLRAELAPYGVGVSVLCPGLVATRLTVSTSKLTGIGSGTEGMTGGFSRVEPAWVAERVLRAIKANSQYIVTHGEYGEAVADRGRGLDEAFKATPISPAHDPSKPVPGVPQPRPMVS
jgi:NAD(P)-dependent dehydrogenase (short-subunit alcohol dehydrogenase family)